MGDDGGGGTAGREFSLELPLRSAGCAWSPTTHVVELCGDHDRFWSELTRMLANTSASARVLTSPVWSLGAVADALNATGAATVLSIDAVSQTGSR